MSDFQQYLTILKVIRKNKPASFNFLNNRKKKETPVLTLGADPKSPVKKVLGVIALIVLAIFGLGYIGVMCGMTAVSAISANVFKEYLYVMVLASQVIVLFFGVPTALSIMYYSKDNALLSTLPIKKTTLFLARFTLTYLTQLFMSMTFSVLIIGSAGVAGLIVGYAIPWTYFLVMVFVGILTPVLPLLLVSILALPIMYLLALIKSSKIATTISTGFAVLFGVGLYLGMMLLFGTQGQDSPDGALVAGQGTIAMYTAIAKATIFNYPIVESLIGNNVAINSLIYIAVLLVVGGVSVLLSSLMYGKAMAFVSEGATHTAKKKEQKIPEYRQRSIIKSFLIKDFKEVTGTPMLMVQTLMTIFVTPILIFFYSLMFGKETGEDAVIMQTVLLNIAVMMSFMMTAMANQFAMVGFSKEAQNLAVLKSMPIDAKMLCKTKLCSAMAITIINIVVSTISVIAIVGEYNLVFIIGYVAILLVGGYGMNCFALNKDLSKPNLTWTNINELTKNNTRMIAPALLGMLMSFIVFGVGMVTSLVLVSLIGKTLAYLIWFGGMLIIAVPLALLSHKRYFKNPAEKLAKIEG